MLTLEQQNVLDDAIISRVCMADAAEEPITAVRGPWFDKRLKAQLKLPHHQGIICQRVNMLVEAGMLRFESSAELQEMGFASGAPLRHPVVVLLPA